MTTSPRTVNCPSCDKEIVWDTKNEFRPFCSERCKLIDFGDWANERHTIPGTPVYPVEDEQEDPLQ